MKFRSIIQEIVAKEKVHMTRNDRGARGHVHDDDDSDDYGDEHARLLDDRRREEAARFSQQVAYQDDVITEREDSIRALEATMLDLNEMFEDVAMIVAAQGQKLDSVKANVSATHEHVDSGAGQLTKASTYQKKARNKVCILLVIVAIVAAILTI